MDHSWNQLNQFNQQYQRLAAAASNSVAGNPRIDFPQALLEPTGLSALSPPLPAHTLQTNRIGVGTLPAMNYAHTLPVGMGLESLSAVTSLGTSFSTQSPYTKSVPVCQPAFSLDPSHAAADVARHLANSSSSSRSDALPTHTTSSSMYVGSAMDTAKTWGLSQYLPGQTGQYMPVNVNSSVSDYSTPHVEPPPAHSGSVGSRPSTIQRNPFTQSVGSREALLSREALIEEQRLKRVLSKPEPPAAHISANRLLAHQPYSKSVLTSSQPPPPSPQYSSSSVSQHISSSHTSSDILRSSNSAEAIRSSAASYRSSPQITSSSLQHSSNYSTYSSANAGSSMNYEAVSPAAPTHTDHYDTNIALHGLADISSNREKLPLQEKHVSHHRSQQQVGMRMQDMSPPMATSMQQQPSPINTGSPQIPLSTMAGSPQAHVPSSSVPPAHMPVQAVPDSTTKPKRKRQPKKKVDKLLEPPISSHQTVIPGHAHYDHQAMTQNYVNTLNHGYEQQQQAQQHAAAVAENMAAAHAQYFNPMVVAMEAIEGGGEEPIFMTNAFGSAFVNPNDAMGVNENDVYDENSPNRNKLRTKAEQKMPPLASVQDDFDEEFAHLAAPPDETKIRKKSPPRFTPLGNPVSPPRNPTNQNETVPPDNTAGSGDDAASTAAAPKTDQGFQNSFMSFLQGKKPETLSSVTNQAITKRPPMPVYIPDTRPRRVVEEPRRSRNRRSSSDSDFSDSDDMDGISKTVQNVISNLGDEGGSNPKVPPITISIKGLSKRARGGGPMVKSPRSKGGKGRSTPRSGSSRNKVVILDSDDETGTAPKGKPPSPGVIPRERVSRKAKEKVEQKRKAKMEKRKKGGNVSDNDSDYVQISTDDEEHYDSDKDPSWCPGEGPPMLKPGSDDDILRPGKRMKLNMPPIRKSVTSIKSNKAIHASDSSNNTQMMTSPAKPSEPQPSYDENGEYSPHSFMKGDFVIDKKDLTNVNGFAIWRIDAGRLLQKFEPIVKDGALVGHKALSTYSSWSDNIRKQYKGIEVKLVSQGRGADVVEVTEEYRPKPGQGEPEKTAPTDAQQTQLILKTNEDDALLTSFNVYMQIVVSQALEPGFLSAITQEKDDYYFGPLEHIDKLVRSSKLQFLQGVSWSPEFQAAADQLPYYKIIDKSSSPGAALTPCQACLSCGQPMHKAIQLYGEGYCHDTLEPSTVRFEPREYGVCTTAGVQVQQYHRLQHFKFMLYKRCLAKVDEIREKVEGIDMREILDACLQNRDWVNELYEDMLKLVNKGVS